MARKPFHCCCGGGGECPEYCSSGLSDTLSVAINGSANGTCDGTSFAWTGDTWADVDGNYTIDRNSCVGWSKEFTSPYVELDSTFSGCGGVSGYKLAVQVRFLAGKLQGIVQASGSNINGFLFETYVFEKAVTYPVDCCGWSSYDLPYVSKTKSIWNADYAGDLTGATFKITSGACS